jgi:hypothetical protein
MKWLCRSVLVLLACGLLLTGCKPVNVKRSYDIPQAGTDSVILAPPKSEQTVRIAVRSPEVPVDVYVVLGESEDKLEQQLKGGDLVPRNPHETKKNVSDEAFDVKIPANKAFAVVMHNKKGKKNAHVELEVVNK